MGTAGGPGTWASAVLVGATALGSAGCSLLPAEFNLSPLFRQRLDEQGRALEVDVLWPIFHYERTPEGGSDFRIRPFYRRVTEPEPIPGAGDATDHQFLWPLGRVRSDDQESLVRLFPLFWRQSRINDKGERDIDGYVLFPFIWFGAGAEPYLAVFPLWADIPQFLTYERFQSILWPLWTAVEKNGQKRHIVLWPFVAWNEDLDGSGKRWFRVIPLWLYDIDPGVHERYGLLWPLFTWGTENIEGGDPTYTFLFWPLWGTIYGGGADGWMFLWPFFQKTSKEGIFKRVNVLWPLWRYYENRLEDDVRQWWLWPLMAHTTTNRQRAWNFLWPLIWIREYFDPDGRQSQQWFLPLFWHVRQEHNDGTVDDFVKVWPLFHTDSKRDGRGDWSLPSPWPWREGNSMGMEEAYGWLWTLARGISRTPDDHAFHTAAHLYTTRTRKTATGHNRTQTSFPFLFNYEGDENGGTLRLFQFLPIPFGGGGDRP